LIPGFLVYQKFRDFFFRYFGIYIFSLFLLWINAYLIYHKFQGDTILMLNSLKYIDYHRFSFYDLDILLRHGSGFTDGNLLPIAAQINFWIKPSAVFLQKFFFLTGSLCDYNLYWMSLSWAYLMSLSLVLFLSVLHDIRAIWPILCCFLLSCFFSVSFYKESFVFLALLSLHYAILNHLQFKSKFIIVASLYTLYTLNPLAIFFFLYLKLDKSEKGKIFYLIVFGFLLGLGILIMYYPQFSSKIITYHQWTNYGNFQIAKNDYSSAFPMIFSVLKQYVLWYFPLISFSWTNVLLQIIILLPLVYFFKLKKINPKHLCCFDFLALQIITLFIVLLYPNYITVLRYMAPLTLFLVFQSHHTLNIKKTSI
jgi:hypothetical protein